jgi:hypothetical protein
MCVMIDTRLEFTDGHRRCHRAAAQALPAARQPGHGERNLRHITRHAVEVARATSRRIPHAAVVALILTQSCAPQLRPGLAPTSSDQRSLSAKVVWAYGGRAYIASEDSLPLHVVDAVVFALKKRVVASGVVQRLDEPYLAMVAISWGSLDGIRLDRLKVIRQRDDWRLPWTLRVGYPSRDRESLLLRFDGVIVDPFWSLAYKVDSLSPNLLRELRVRPTGESDTLFIRFFEESTDEEIALERGELDIGVFWPGELSREIRSRADWVFARGNVEGAFAVTPIGNESPPAHLPTRDDFVELDRDVFRGDLGLWPDSTRTGPSRTTPIPSGIRFDFDPSSPGKLLLERALNRQLRHAGRESVVLMRVFYVRDWRNVGSRIDRIATYLRAPSFPTRVRDRGARLAGIGHGTWPEEAQWMRNYLRDSALVAPVFEFRRVLVIHHRLGAQLGVSLVDELTERVRYHIGDRHQ